MQDGGLAVTFTEIIKAIFAGLATAAVWLLKKLGERHIASIDTLNNKMDKLIEKMEILGERVTVVEVRMKHMEDDSKAQ
jgi:membrane protein implicated in regulation of membrane protease activity